MNLAQTLLFTELQCQLKATSSTWPKRVWRASELDTCSPISEGRQAAYNIPKFIGS
jgi:hypothetical protein